jgi:hypothetical protein
MDADPKIPEIILGSPGNASKGSPFDTDASSRSAREFKEHKKE